MSLRLGDSYGILEGIFFTNHQSVEPILDRFDNLIHLDLRHTLVFYLNRISPSSTITPSTFSKLSVNLQQTHYSTGI
ncbi:Protein of unknown function [Pyronema omphalodes CBS 100304]|uniref:Uncharacterized protein n=1 Tax=Pyronema omphalodes (strain CBS 100304) TaxID=1076935 RepID=U4LK75_PYROM|nr:Protein of unknown function [Pyronema omphalodes CBS 100304]